MIQVIVFKDHATAWKITATAFCFVNLSNTSIFVIIVTKNAPFGDGSRSTADDCVLGCGDEREEGEDGRVKGARCTNLGSVT